MFEKSFLVEGIFKHISGNRQTGKGIQKLNERKRINEQNRKKDCMHIHGSKSDSDLHPVCEPATAKAAEEETTERVVRVGSFEDTFNYVNEKGARKGYGYELLETLSGYTGWKFEYVTCDWSNCFEKLINGEFDIMGDISYTEERAKQMLFSDEPMGEEKYYLYADLSDTDISAYNFQTLNGKRIGVLKGTQPEVMLTEWEQKYNLETTHVNIANNNDVKRKLADHEIDAFVSLEESLWAVQGISTVVNV